MARGSWGHTRLMAAHGDGAAMGTQGGYGDRLSIGYGDRLSIGRLWGQVIYRAAMGIGYGDRLSIESRGPIGLSAFIKVGSCGQTRWGQVIY